MKQYTCAMCGQTYDEGWTEEEAIKEATNNFGKEIKIDEMEVVCDDCYEQFIKPQLN